MDSVEKKDTLEALLEANLKFYNKLNSNKVYSIKGSELKDLVTSACMLAMVAIDRERERSEKDG